MVMVDRRGCQSCCRCCDIVRDIYRMTINSPLSLPLPLLVPVPDVSKAEGPSSDSPETLTADAVDALPMAEDVMGALELTEWKGGTGGRRSPRVDG
jgi:hypothetical protein